jgi:peroxiredoxin family protein
MVSGLVIALTRGSLENLLVASTTAGGAVALDMDVDIYLLLGGAYAFKKDVVERDAHYYDRPELKEEMLAGVRQNNVPMPLASLRRLKREGKVKIHVCSTAGKIWGAAALDDYVDLVDDIVGIVEYISRAEQARLLQVL